LSVAASDALHERVRAFVRASTAGESCESFDTLACDIARHQAQHVPSVARLMRARNVDPEQLALADDIPAVPCEAFRLRRIAAHPAALDVRCFMTSGTTGGDEARGRHPMRTTETYELGALAWGRAMLWPDDAALDFVGLTAPEDVAPESSLSFMLARFAEALNGRVSWHWDGERLDVEGIATACERAADEGRALLVAGTSFAFVHLSDALADRVLTLPPSSRVMQTGGFKGRSRQVEATTLRQIISAQFGLSPDRVVAEYGMTELSSQLYQASLVKAAPSSSYRAPPWLRVSAVDAVTLAPTNGEGLARMVDLANVDSAVAVQTHDLVHQRDDGIQLLGRAPGATPRGCSLALEHLLDGEL
jgi:hypothetical protein